MKRLFAAIKVHADEHLLTLYNNLKKSLYRDQIKWVDEKNIHITLKFFGETHEERIDDICEVFDDVAARHQPFTIRLQNTGIFGSSYNPRVIWFGMEKCQAVEDLADDIMVSLKKIGFEPDGQHFRAHLTVGRIKDIRNKRFFQQSLNAYKDVFIQEVPVSDFQLFESNLRPQGPIYEVIETFRLG